MRVLVLAPHPDDMEYGLGGTIAKMQDKWEVTCNITCSLVDYARQGEGWVGTRFQDAENAAEVLGVQLRWGCWFEENLGSPVDRGELVKAIEEEIKLLEPHLLFVCAPSVNQDHQLLYEATMTAIRKVGKFPYLSGIYAYEYPETHVVSDIPPYGRMYSKLSTKALTTKLQALALHTTQCKTTDSDYFQVSTMAASRGFECGAEHAEKFLVIKEIT